MARRFVHFEVLCTAKYRYGEKFLHRKIKFYISVHEIMKSVLLKCYEDFLKIGMAALISPYRYFAMQSTPKCRKRRTILSQYV
jgi:hypothetical protein